MNRITQLAIAAVTVAGLGSAFAGSVTTIPASPTGSYCHGIGKKGAQVCRFPLEILTTQTYEAVSANLHQVTCAISPLNAKIDQGSLTLTLNKEQSVTWTKNTQAARSITSNLARHVTAQVTNNQALISGTNGALPSIQCNFDPS